MTSSYAADLPASDRVRNSSGASGFPLFTFTLGIVIPLPSRIEPSMNAETLPTERRSPSESTRMLWLTSTGVSANP